MIVTLLLAVLSTSSEPWIVIDTPTTPPNARFDSVYRPNIAKLGDRVLLTTYEHTAHYGSYGTHVLRSDDAGVTWQHRAHVPAARSANLFTVGDTAYLLSVDGKGRGNHGPLTLRASKDGRAWTGGEGQHGVRLRGDDQIDGGRSALFVASGRVWFTFSSLRILHAKGETATSIALASAALTDDLLDPKSWRWSADFELADTGLNWKYPTLVASVIHGQSPRLFAAKDGEVRAILDVASDGWRLRHRHQEPTFVVPDKLGDVGLVRDEPSGAYWALSVSTNRPMTAEESYPPRNVLTLHRSERMSDWRHIVLVDDQRATSAKYYSAEWTIDGDDLLTVLTGLFPSDEDATKLTKSLVFLRIPRFRDVDALRPIVVRDRG